MKTLKGLKFLAMFAMAITVATPYGPVTCTTEQLEHWDGVAERNRQNLQYQRDKHPVQHRRRQQEFAEGLGLR